MASAQSRGIVSIFCKDQGRTGSAAENIVDVKSTENRFWVYVQGARLQVLGRGYLPGLKLFL
jgi:hypothetical protein